MILVKEKAVLAGAEGGLPAAEEELPVQAVGEVLGEALEEDVHHRLH
ncbi:hypothetical protein [Fictibacillus gelatini]|nr:hypothetical protein [Fictibacillus gelatini]